MPTPHRDTFLATLRATHPPADLLGVLVDTIPLETLAEALIAWLEEADAPLHLVTLNPEILERACREPEVMTLIRQADLIVPDGAGIRWGIRRRTGRQVTTVPGIDLAHRLLELSTARGWEVFFLGGAPGVAETAGERLQTELPGLNLVGTDHGYHRDTPENPKDETRVINTLIALQPDILLVGMGSPAQEAFIQRVLPRLSRTIMIGVGGSFDVWAGLLPRAPRWMAQLHLEWLFRMLRQPARFRRFPQLLAYVRRVLTTPTK